MATIKISSLYSAGADQDSSSFVHELTAQQMAGVTGGGSSSSATATSSNDFTLTITNGSGTQTIGGITINQNSSASAYS